MAKLPAKLARVTKGLAGKGALKAALRFLGPVGLALIVGEFAFGQTVGKAKKGKRQLLEDALLGGPSEELFEEIEQEGLNPLLKDVLDVQTGLEGTSTGLEIFGAARAAEEAVGSQLNQIADIAQRSEPTAAEQIARLRALLG